MIDPLEPSTFSVTDLQLTWLRELGIDKPWLPATHVSPLKPAMSSPGRVLVSPATVAPRLEQKPVEPVRKPDAQVNVNHLINLQAVASAVIACENCGLCRERERPVVGDGALKPQVLVIGESPGEQEDRQGKAFVGRSGQLLGNMLSAVGLSADTTVYMTNAIKCRPPGNRNPRDEEIRACKPYLLRQIELLEPRALLLLGRFAVSAVLGDQEPWQQLRGQSLHYVSGGSSIPVVVSFHPAYLLSRPEEKAAAWQDLIRLRNQLEKPEQI